MTARWRWVANLRGLPGGARVLTAALALGLPAGLQAATGTASESPGELVDLPGACQKRLPEQPKAQNAQVGDFLEPGHRITCERPGILRFRLPASGYPVEVQMEPGYPYVVPRGRQALRLRERTRPGLNAGVRGSSVDGVRTVAHGTPAPDRAPDMIQQSELTTTELHMADLASAIAGSFRHRLAQIDATGPVSPSLVRDFAGMPGQAMPSSPEATLANELREDVNRLAALTNAVTVRTAETAAELAQLAKLDTAEPSPVHRARRLTLLTREQEMLGLAVESLDDARLLWIAWTKQLSEGPDPAMPRAGSSRAVDSYRQALEGLAQSISKYRQAVVPLASRAAR